MYWPSAVTCMSVEAMGIEKSWISSIRLRRSGNRQNKRTQSLNLIRDHLLGLTDVILEQCSSLPLRDPLGQAPPRAEVVHLHVIRCAHLHL